MHTKLECHRPQDIQSNVQPSINQNDVTLIMSVVVVVIIISSAHYYICS